MKQFLMVLVAIVLMTSCGSRVEIVNYSFAEVAATLPEAAVTGDRDFIRSRREIPPKFIYEISHRSDVGLGKFVEGGLTNIAIRGLEDNQTQITIRSVKNRMIYVRDEEREELIFGQIAQALEPQSAPVGEPTPEGTAQILEQAATPSAVTLVTPDGRPIPLLKEPVAGAITDPSLQVGSVISGTKAETVGLPVKDPNGVTFIKVTITGASMAKGTTAWVSQGVVEQTTE